MQIIIILEKLKDFFPCKIVLAASHHYPEISQRLFFLQNCLRCKSFLSWKNSKTFSPAKLSQPHFNISLISFKKVSPANLSQLQIIIILELFKDFFACKFVLAAKHHYPENIHRLFRQQNCLSRKSFLSLKYSKTFFLAKLCQMQIIIILEKLKDFFPCKIVLAASHHYPEISQRLFFLQNCLRCKSFLSWKNSKTFSPAKLSQPHFNISLISFKKVSPANLSQIPIIIILKVFKDFFACKLVLSAKHHYPENIQRNFACKISLAANHHYAENFQRLFFLQNCLRCNSSLSWKYSKTFSTAKMSQTQIIIILKTFKDFFACKFVLDPNHHYLKVFKDFFSCKFVLSATHHYPENMQRNFACKVVLAAKHHYPENIQRLFRQQNCLSRKSSLS